MDGAASRPPADGRSALVADLLLGLAVFLTRVAFLFDGYGTDPDAWRVVWAGRTIAATGAYHASRNPGYPIPEFAAAALAGQPAWIFNALTAFFGAVAVVLFGRLLRRLGAGGPAWIAGALALAFTPVVAIHSSDGMDYLWALAFIMGAFLLALDGRATLAGICLGLAAGCRPTSLAFLLPCGLLLGGRSARGDRVRLCVAALATAVVAFAPVWTSMGTTFLSGYQRHYPPLLYMFKNLSIEVWGAVGLAALAIAVIGSALVRRPNGEATFSAPVPKRVAGAAALAIGVAVLLFLAMPHEPAYLIPAVPFVLLLFAIRLPRRGFIALSLAVAASSLVLKVSEAGKPDAPHVAGPTTHFTVAGHELELHLQPGPLGYDRERRRLGLRYAASVRATAAALPGSSAIVAYEWLPMLRALANGETEGRVRYVYLLSADQFDALRAAGNTIYDLPGATEQTRGEFGYDLHERGSQPLPAPFGADPSVRP